MVSILAMCWISLASYPTSVSHTFYASRLRFMLESQFSSLPGLSVGRQYPVTPEYFTWLRSCECGLSRLTSSGNTTSDKPFGKYRVILHVDISVDCVIQSPPHGITYPPVYWHGFFSDELAYTQKPYHTVMYLSWITSD